MLNFEIYHFLATFFLFFALYPTYKNKSQTIAIIQIIGLAKEVIFDNWIKGHDIQMIDIYQNILGAIFGAIVYIIIKHKL